MTPVGGPAFARLWAAAGASTLADGVLLIALPLLAADLTRDPLQVSVVASIGWLPWLVIGPLAGALVDRWDRKRILAYSAAVRVAGVSGLAAATVLDRSSVALLLIVGFCLGCGRALFDSSSQAIIPDLVGRAPRALQLANSRLVGTQMVNELFAGGPIGGLLYAVAVALPFVCGAVLYAASCVMSALIPRPNRIVPATDPGTATTVRTEIVEGMRYLAGHRLLLTLAVTAAMVNLAFMAGEAILVIFAKERLGLGSVGFGLLTIPPAIGGLLASMFATRLTQRFGPGTTLIGTLVALAIAQFCLGLATSPWLAGAALAVSGAGAALYNILAQSLRQSTVPNRLLGRVIATSRLIGLGAIPLGGVVGGVLAHQVGLSSPFLVGAAALALTALAAAKVITNRAFAAPAPNQDGKAPSQ